ncbi:CDP-alcohol phosphatidyltransferase family protein [Sneathiella sp. P13V-1]|uniref:CDP-alcohol phosphatidyltransferase family protein n=1 Tax=Sneathiella sp. P13V-1 TaxID=2697366 RepID=UPI00187BB400|nr:CDP-alcohol phosphatidyltransferase family protein [Sneathiella sp. P13V-1]MBE7637149.1 CDP-alcohol phosphatidyltransferase family protein [Sneathiella sp. P13V-1]
MNIPNSITLARILFVPLIVWLILKEERMAAFVVFVLSGVSDALDGLIAKQFNSVTRLGKYLDPLADKILLVSIYVTLGFKEDIPSWLVILVVSRDLLIVGGILFSYLMDVVVKIRPSRISKVNTFFQILLAAVVLGAGALDLSLGFVVPLIVYTVAITTVLSGFDYLRMWMREYNQIGA